jgi:uncharacterized protein DUF397
VLVSRTAGEDGVTGKPTVEGLGIDVAAQDWQRSGVGEGSIEVAFVHGKDLPSANGPGADGPGADGPGADGPGQGGDVAGGARTEWVLMRVTGDPDGRVLVYDRNEWECFLDGVRNGEFQDASE